jgi:hypothetical protein
MLALSALMLGAADQEPYRASSREQASKVWGHWLGVLVLLVLAAASSGFGILHPEALAAQFG